MNATEASVAQDGDDVTGQCQFSYLSYDRLDVWKIPSLTTEAGDICGEFCGIEPVIFWDLV